MFLTYRSFLKKNLQFLDLIGALGLFDVEWDSKNTLFAEILDWNFYRFLGKLFISVKSLIFGLEMNLIYFWTFYKNKLDK